MSKTAKIKLYLTSEEILLKIKGTVGFWGVQKWLIYTITQLFLENVSEEYKEFEIIMQLDGAGWYKAKGLKLSSNIHFIPQHPYSPEVNPTEYLWDEIREKHLHNKIFDSLAETMEVVCRGINELNEKPEYVKSMTLFPYLNIRF